MNCCIKKGCSFFIVLMCVMGFLLLINIYHSQESFGIGLDEEMFEIVMPPAEPFFSEDFKSFNEVAYGNGVFISLQVGYNYDEGEYNYDEFKGNFSFGTTADIDESELINEVLINENQKELYAKYLLNERGLYFKFVSDDQIYKKEGSSTYTGISEESYIYLSKDGKDWSIQETLEHVSLLEVEFLNDNFYALGFKRKPDGNTPQHGVIYRSSDGKHWDRIYKEVTPAGAVPSNLVYSNGVYVFRLNSEIFTTSDNFKTLQMSYVRFSNLNTMIYFANGYFFVMDDQGDVVLYSKSGEIWNKVENQSEIPFDFKKAFYKARTGVDESESSLAKLEINQIGNILANVDGIMLKGDTLVKEDENYKDDDQFGSFDFETSIIYYRDILDEGNLFYSIGEGPMGTNVDLAVGEDGIVISSHLTGLVYFSLSNLEREKSRDISVKLNDRLVKFDQPPIIDSGRTLVPVRAIFEALGATVEWIPETRTVLSTLDGTDIVIQIDSTIATVNKTEEKLDVPAQIVGGRTLVPLRFVGESFGLEVDWIDELRQVVLSGLAEKEYLSDNEKKTTDLNNEDEENETIVFSDENLEKAIRQEINKPTGNVYLKDVSEIKVLELSDNNIEDISALSNLTSLEKLWLRDNNIANINGLAKLTNLEILELSGNNITDISTLASLTSLKLLWLEDNHIANINALANLSNLDMLGLSGNDISDISLLSNLTDLELLMLRDNRITNINGLSNLTNLSQLRLEKNNIADISALANLSNLNILKIIDNNITDISALANLTNLEWLNLLNNDITDISPLSNLTNLKVLSLDGNPITDFSPLDSLPHINRVNYVD